MNTDALHIACAHCGATNRLPAARLGDQPDCGRCHQPLLSGAPIELVFPKEGLGWDLEAVGIAKGNTELKALINKGIQALHDDGTYASIQKKHFGDLNLYSGK